MTGVRRGAVLAGHRDAVAVLLETGEPFGDVEDWIDESAELSADEKAALWLFAFSLRDSAAEELRPVGEMQGQVDRPRPRELQVRGFPVARLGRTIVERVARLLNRLHPESDEKGVSCPTSAAPPAG